MVQVLRVRAAGGVVVAEHPVTDGEARHRPGRPPRRRPANSLPRIGHPRPRQPGERPDEARRARPGTPQSVRFTVVACTLTSTSSSAATGFGTSITRTTSGGPYLSYTAAFMAAR